MDAHYYQINLHWETDRQGLISSPELNQSFVVATPPPFQGGIERTWSPEHLLTASVNSCFMTTFLAIAANSKLEFSKFECESKGKLEQVEGKYLMTEITLSPILTISKASDQERAERILMKSEAACLISNSIKSKVVLHPTVIVN
ncbi:MAG: OsmC family protein [Bacteroidia bacterium]|nr:OsmC family protein [Bacteroidota bacterium]MBP9081656.1 OsmC family protein [Bacteroidia bacterium]MBK7387609.1 OsmC family protein [Bacteroidota bacterium]MBK7971277.1 OsmC family protein [Bacteroidota bacterium]MBK8872635.1 OsmC family protein [Bacteroidota bacterium]